LRLESRLSPQSALQCWPGAFAFICRRVAQNAKTMFRHRCRYAVILEANDGSALVVPADVGSCGFQQISRENLRRRRGPAPAAAVGARHRAKGNREDMQALMRPWDMAVARVLIVLADFAITIIPPAAAQIDQPSIDREARSEYQLENSRRTFLPVTRDATPRLKDRRESHRGQ
jgi:hypothetical protein